MSAASRATRARLAALSRHRSANDPAIAAAEAEHHAQALADHVERVVGTLTAEQRDRIAALLATA